MAYRIHLWSGLAAVPFVAVHVFPGVKRAATNGMEQLAALQNGERKAARRRMWAIAGETAGVLVAVVLVAGAAYQTPNLSTAKLPKGYQLPYGKDPFAPSLATTESGKPVAAEVLASSQSCGASGCHHTIYNETRAGAHTWASQDIALTSKSTMWVGCNCRTSATNGERASGIMLLATRSA
ncbi:MAG: hypothetical protein ACP5M4_14610 [Acidobacteriaceae bacterium]